MRNGVKFLGIVSIIAILTVIAINVIGRKIYK